MWCSTKFLLWKMAEQCLFKVATSIFLFFRVPTSWFIIFVTVRATSLQISWSLVHTWISNVLFSQVPAINNVWLGAVQKVCILQYVLTLAAIFSETVTPTSITFYMPIENIFVCYVMQHEIPTMKNGRTVLIQSCYIERHLAICSDFGSHYLSNRYSDEHHIWHAHREHFGVLCDAARNSYYEKWPNSAYSKLLPRFSCFSGSLLRDSLFS